MSSRGLEQTSYRDVAVRMLCADRHPDHRSIARRTSSSVATAPGEPVGAGLLLEAGHADASHAQLVGGRLANRAEAEDRDVHFAVR